MIKAKNINLYVVIEILILVLLERILSYLPSVALTFYNKGLSLDFGTVSIPFLNTQGGGMTLMLAVCVLPIAILIMGFIYVCVYKSNKPKNIGKIVAGTVFYIVAAVVMFIVMFFISTKILPQTILPYTIKLILFPLIRQGLICVIFILGLILTKQCSFSIFKLTKKAVGIIAIFAILNIFSTVFDEFTLHGFFVQSFMSADTFHHLKLGYLQNVSYLISCLLILASVQVLAVFCKKSIENKS